MEGARDGGKMGHLRPLPRFDDSTLEERIEAWEDDLPTLTHRSTIRPKRRRWPPWTRRSSPRATDESAGGVWRDPRSWTCVVLGAALGVVSGVLFHVETSECDGAGACGERAESPRLEPRPTARAEAPPTVAHPPAAAAGSASRLLPTVRVNDLPRAR